MGRGGHLIGRGRGKGYHFNLGKPAIVKQAEES